MNTSIKYSALLLLLTLCGGVYALDEQDYWICSTHDRTNKEWVVKNSYQKMALNLSFDQCKKQSTVPSSCKTSMANCEGFHLGMSTKPYWRCTALDAKAQAWASNYYANREDAAIAAQAYCKNKSALPATCYTNMVTCININEGQAN